MMLGETVCANGTTIPPIVIVQGTNHMASWYEKSDIGPIRVFTSDSGYINNKIALHYINHLILHIGRDNIHP